MFMGRMVKISIGGVSASLDGNIEPAIDEVGPLFSGGLSYVAMTVIF
jgi:hypothetical protein